jgi:hypothetical protein
LSDDKLKPGEITIALSGIITKLDDFDKRLTKIESDYKQMAQLNDMLVNNQILKILTYPSIRELILTEIRKQISLEFRRMKMTQASK